MPEEGFRESVNESVDEIAVSYMNVFHTWIERSNLNEMLKKVSYGIRLGPRL